MIIMTIKHYLICRLKILIRGVYKTELDYWYIQRFKECQNACFKALSIVITAGYKPELIRIVSFITLTPDSKDKGQNFESLGFVFTRHFCFVF